MPSDSGYQQKPTYGHYEISNNDDTKSRIAPGKRTLTSRLPARSESMQRKAAGLASTRSQGVSAAVRAMTHIDHPAANAALGFVPDDMSVLNMPMQSRSMLDQEHASTIVASSMGHSGGDRPAESLARDLMTQGPTSHIADIGFSGRPTSLPHKEEMERSFNRDFSSVQVYTDSSAKTASTALGAQAYTRGHHIAFAEENPSRALVAHELTHVVQQSGDAGASLASDDDAESQAERVEEAVTQGRSALSILPKSRAGLGDRRRVQRKYGMTMTFSPDSFALRNQYKIWSSRHPIRFPWGSLPVWFLITPDVVVYGDLGGTDSASGSAGYGALGIRGAVGLGVGGGIPDIFEPYAQLQPSLSGEARLKKGRNWNLTAEIKLNISGFAGVRLFGFFNHRYRFCSLDIFEITGIDIDQDGFHSDRLGFRLSDDVEEMWENIQGVFTRISSWRSDDSIGSPQPLTVGEEMPSVMASIEAKVQRVRELRGILSQECNLALEEELRSLERELDTPHAPTATSETAAPMCAPEEPDASSTDEAE